MQIISDTTVPPLANASASSVVPNGDDGQMDQDELIVAQMVQKDVDQMDQNEMNEVDKQQEDIYEDDEAVIHVPDPALADGQNIIANPLYGVNATVTPWLRDPNNVPSYIGINWTEGSYYTAPKMTRYGETAKATDSHICGFMATMIPHMLGKTFNRIAFLDPLWHPAMRVPITSML
uniref:Uncharacterized protein n=1 Tax=Panagrolaimus sp. ES5 TaxID=591445 RepID=A0AC34GMG2_9BILA